MPDQVPGTTNLSRSAAVEAIESLQKKGADLNPYSLAEELEVSHQLIISNGEIMELLSLARGEINGVVAAEYDRLVSRLETLQRELDEYQAPDDSGDSDSSDKVDSYDKNDLSDKGSESRRNRKSKKNKKNRELQESIKASVSSSVERAAANPEEQTKVSPTLSDLRAEFELKERELLSRIENYQQAQVELQTANQQLEADLSESSSNIERMEARLAESEEKCSNLEAELAQLSEKKEGSALRNDDEELEHANALNQNLAKEISKLREQVKAMESAQQVLALSVQDSWHQGYESAKREYEKQLAEMSRTAFGAPGQGLESESLSWSAEAAQGAAVEYDYSGAAESGQELGVQYDYSASSQSGARGGDEYDYSASESSSSVAAEYDYSASAESGQSGSLEYDYSTSSESASDAGAGVYNQNSLDRSASEAYGHPYSQSTDYVQSTDENAYRSDAANGEPAMTSHGYDKVSGQGAGSEYGGMPPAQNSADSVQGFAPNQEDVQAMADFLVGPGGAAAARSAPGGFAPLPDQGINFSSTDPLAAAGLSLDEHPLNAGLLYEDQSHAAGGFAQAEGFAQSEGFSRADEYDGTIQAGLDSAGAGSSDDPQTADGYSPYGIAGEYPQPDLNDGNQMSSAEDGAQTITDYTLPDYMNQGFFDEAEEGSAPVSGFGNPDADQESSDDEDEDKSKAKPFDPDELRGLLHNRNKKDDPAGADESGPKTPLNKFVGGKHGTQEHPASATHTRLVPPDIRKACMLLGIKPEDLSKQHAIDAWKREMSKPGVHPDTGGDTEMAMYLNNAKDTLVRYLDAQAPKLGKVFGSTGKDGKDNPKGDNR